MSVKKCSANTVSSGFPNRLSIICRPLKKRLFVRTARSTGYRIYRKDVNWHSLHYDVMEIVCKHVDWKGLTNMAKTCKGWHYAAFSEKSRRFYIQRLRIPWKIYMSLPSMLHAEPSTSLLVYDSRMDVTQTVKHKLLNTFKELLRHNVIVVAVDEYLTTEDAEFRDTGKQCEIEDGSSTDILGLFLYSPSSTKQQIRIDIAWIPGEMLVSKSHDRDTVLADRFAEDLGLNDREYPKSTILLLVNGFLPKNKIICELGKRIQDSGQEITLAVLRTVKVEGATNGESSHGSYSKSHVALRISGPNVKSWSTYIRYVARRREINRNLRTLRERVKSKQHNVGMIGMSRCTREGCRHTQHPAQNSRKMMSDLKQMFPDVRFTAFFVNTNARYRTDEFDQNDAFNSGKWR